MRKQDFPWWNGQLCMFTGTYNIHSHPHLLHWTFMRSTGGFRTQSGRDPLIMLGVQVAVTSSVSRPSILPAGPTGLTFFHLLILKNIFTIWHLPWCFVPARKPNVWKLIQVPNVVIDMSFDFIFRVPWSNAESICLPKYNPNIIRMIHRLRHRVLNQQIGFRIFWNGVEIMTSQFDCSKTNFQRIHAE